MEAEELEVVDDAVKNEVVAEGQEGEEQLGLGVPWTTHGHWQLRQVLVQRRNDGP